MSKLRLTAFLLAAYSAGIAFVVACGDDVLPFVDAGSHADAADCSGCEPAITADRIYQVEDRTSQPSGTNVFSDASCADGDVLLGGGCYVGESAGGGRIDPWPAHPLVVAGPIPAGSGGGPAFPNRYFCSAENDELHPGVIVIATAICFKPAAP